MSLRVGSESRITKSELLKGKDSSSVSSYADYREPLFLKIFVWSKSWTKNVFGIRLRDTLMYKKLQFEQS